MERILLHFGDKLDFAVVCEEDHAEREEPSTHPSLSNLPPFPPGKHLHAVIALKEKTRIRGADCFDHLAGSHGDYRAARHLQASVKYVVKDGNYLSHNIDVEAYLKAAQKKTSTMIAIKCKEGLSIREIDEADPGFMLMNLSKVKAYLQFQQVIQLTPTKTWLPVTAPSGISIPIARLAAWMNQNLNSTRTLRQKQLLLSSPPRMGKTTLIEELRNYFNVYSHCGSKWFDGFDDSVHNLIVFDEFNGCVPLSIMNKVLDGSQCILEIKGGTVVKSHKQPVIILTNYEEHELYCGQDVRPAVREAFFDRLDYLRLERGDEPWRLIPFFNNGEANPEPLVEAAASTSTSSSAMEDEDPIPDVLAFDFSDFYAPQ